MFRYCPIFTDLSRCLISPAPNIRPSRGGTTPSGDGTVRRWRSAVRIPLGARRRGTRHDAYTQHNAAMPDTWICTAEK